MGEQFIGDLANAFRNVTVSRKRALQLIGGAIAVAVPSRLPQAADARRRRKPPLAFVAATVDSVTKNGPDAFLWRVTGAVAHPASNFSVDIVTLHGLAANLPADTVRARIVAALKGVAEGHLPDDVTRDRIAVTLL